MDKIGILKMENNSMIMKFGIRKFINNKFRDTNKVAIEAINNM
jgi:hypothetical protein